MQALCAKCQGTGKVPKALVPQDSQPEPVDAELVKASSKDEPVWVTCPGCLGGGIVDVTAFA